MAGPPSGTTTTTTTTTAAALLGALGAPSDAPEASRAWREVGEEAPPAIKEFKDIAYHSAQGKGLSLQYEPRASLSGPRHEHNGDATLAWTCQAVDMYNSGGARGWSPLACLPFTLTYARDEQTATLGVRAESCGADFVVALGEPSRKGGGEPLKGGGASGLGPPAWMEWKLTLIMDGHATPTAGDTQRLLDVLLMVQLSGDDARGPHRWEKDKGGAARWGVLTIYLAGQ